MNVGMPREVVEMAVRTCNNVARGISNRLAGAAALRILTAELSTDLVELEPLVAVESVATGANQEARKDSGWNTAYIFASAVPGWSAKPVDLELGRQTGFVQSLRGATTPLIRAGDNHRHGGRIDEGAGTPLAYQLTRS